MDDSLEQPNADLAKALTSESLQKDDDEGQSSEDEEDGRLDWEKLPQVLLKLATRISSLTPRNPGYLAQ